MDAENSGEAAYDINTPTVIASENYNTFVSNLQSDIKAIFYGRPTVTISEYFKGKDVNA